MGDIPTCAVSRAIEMYNGLRPVPASSGFSVGLRGARLNELLELRAEKKMSSWNFFVTTPLEGSSDDGISNILHQSSFIHLIPTGTALVDFPLGLGIRSPPHNDSVAIHLFRVYKKTLLMRRDKPETQEYMRHLHAS